MDLAELPARPTPRVMAPDEATERLRGQRVPAIAANVDRACLITDEETAAPVLAYYPLDPGDTEQLRETVLGISYRTLRRDSGVDNISRTFGMAPRRATRQRESCRPTSLATEAPAAHAVIAGLAARLRADLEAFAPDQAAHDVGVMAPVPDGWRVAEDALWTSGVINKSSTLPYHRDGANFDVWSAMPVIRRGMRGGHLHLPEYDLTVGCRDGWVVYFAGYQLLHGVTPMRAITPGGYRYSVVYYALKGMQDCFSYALEVGEARRRRTAREEQTAAVLRGDAVSQVTGKARAAP